MRLRYHDLVGKCVVTQDGQTLGRISDLEAAQDGDRLRVTALLVGPLSLLHRIAPQTARPERVPWRMVAEIGDTVRLRATRAEAVAEEERDG